MTPGEADLGREELDLARQALRAARLLFDADALEDATSRAYYAVFHAARAALTIRGEHAKTHSGLITVFERAHGNEPILSQLFTWRGEADYSTEKFMRTAEQVAAAIDDAERLIERCTGIVDDALTKGPDQPDPPPDL